MALRPVKLLPAVLAILLGMFSLLRGDDILLNGDFMDGKTHWHGDGDAPDTGGRLVITLQPDRWSAVYGTFNSDANALRLKITYTLSDDCSLNAPPSADQMIPPLTAQALEQATGFDSGISNVPLNGGASWMVLLVGGGFYQEQLAVFPRRNKSGPQTFSAHVSCYQVIGTSNLCLVFPPGKGTVTLTGVQFIAPPKAP